MSLKHVLVVDDEDVVREIVQGCLEDVAGWVVATASSGQEGLEKALVEKPDAIVLDVMMPGMDGIAVLQQLKADPVTRFMPVILLTANVDLLDPDRYAELGAVGTIAKPFDPIELVNQIARFLNWSLTEQD